MKKKFLLMSGVVLGVAGLASCAPKADLRTVSMFGGTDAHAAAYQDFMAEFIKENSTEDHQLVIEDSSATADEEWKTSVMSQFYSGDEPDVLFYFNGAAAKPLVDEKKVVSIAEIRKEYPNYAKNINPNTMDPYCVPLKGFVEGLFVNEELFTSDTLKPLIKKDAWTWEEFQTVCTELKKDGKTPVALGAQDVPHYWIEHLILGMNGENAFKNIPTAEAFEAADGKGTTAADGWIKALSMFKTLADDGVFGETKGSQKNDVAGTQFFEGKAGMILDGSWFAGQVGEKMGKDAKVKMMPFPSIPESMGGKNKNFMQSGFTSGFYITTKCWNNPEKRDLAVKFVEKMTSTAAVTRFCKDAGGVPADDKAVVANLNYLNTSINNMPSRTDSATLPLGDTAKANTFKHLVDGSSAYLTANLTDMKAALKKFADAQK